MCKQACIILWKMERPTVVGHTDVGALPEWCGVELVFLWFVKCPNQVKSCSRGQ